MGKRPHFYLIIGVALLMLLVKGAGQGSATEQVVHIDFSSETHALNSEVPPHQFMDLNMLAEQGRGVGSGNRIATLQDAYLVPNSSVLTSMFDGADERTGTVEYEVQEGDVLGGIAVDFGVSVETIVSANNIKNINTIKPGTVLKIPPISGIVYVVKKGDTVGSLAKRYSSDEEKIINYNGLPLAGDLRAGSEIIIPGGVLPASSTALTRNVADSNRFASLPAFEGFFKTPATCRITQRAHIRNGYDCAGPKGTPIYAAASGVINLAKNGNNGGYGNLIRISHDKGLETLYAHLSRIVVSTGDTVQQGELIGYMGSTGRSTGSHLHFEVHGGKNPLASYRLGGSVVAKQ